MIYNNLKKIYVVFANNNYNNYNNYNHNNKKYFYINVKLVRCICIKNVINNIKKK